MCNLCSGRLFLVPNPCCCCELRCGVMWAGFADIVAALVSLYFPLTISVEEKNDIGLTLDKNIQGEDGEPIFQVSIPWLEDKGYIQHACFIQFVSGLMIICAAYGMGGHKFSRFLLGCTWMLFRFILVFLFLIPLIIHVIGSDHGPQRRYGLFFSLHVFVDLYLCFIVRYYTMECYDSYRYENIFKSLQIRREPPVSSKTVQKTRTGKGKQKKKNAPSSWVKPEKNIVDVRNMFQKKRVFETSLSGGEKVPVWDRKNEIIFYGENYMDWDPSVFQVRWEMLNEKEKEEQEKTTKSADNNEKRNLAGFALSLLQIRKMNTGTSGAAESKLGEHGTPDSNNSKRTGPQLSHSTRDSRIHRQSNMEGHNKGLAEVGHPHDFPHPQPGNNAEDEGNVGTGKKITPSVNRTTGRGSKRKKGPHSTNASRIHENHTSLHPQPSNTVGEENVGAEESIAASNYHWKSRRNSKK